MDKLIITITCDSSMSFPGNPHNPTQRGLDAVAAEYVRSVNAGAAICHLHGPYTVDEKLQPDGTKLSDLDLPGWESLRHAIVGKCSPIIQYGIANGRFNQRIELMRCQRPDMMSVCFNAHDECFDYEAGREPVELYAIHDREELAKYCSQSQQLGVQLEVEAFHFGAVWNAMRMVEKGLLRVPAWITFFLGWKGGCWTPPTTRALQYMVDHLPTGFIFNTSVMDPEHAWTVLTMAISLGGHVRVGMEDNPFVVPGKYAETNAELVEKIVRIATELGREIASPAEARAIINGSTKSVRL
ncbi:MAG TPA: 3-keto-5-aminohexanoate cleavage protein [Ktedonobacteraceae bacterium]|nr:3-keto-5-aminohexanoate cleavage protein [Ktedonobacteraceae bacterium]